MKRSLLALTALVALTFAPALGAQSISKVADGLEAFVEETPGALPFAATAGLDWSNAYMGQLIDLDFPFVHLGLGGSLGMTTIPGGGIETLLNGLGGDVDLFDQLPLPFLVINGRVGGLVLPFDLGFKAAFIPEGFNQIGEVGLRYQNFGFDVRYNLIKSDLLMPDISVGGSFNLLSAGVTYALGDTTTYPSSTGNLVVARPEATLDLNATTLEVKGQVSKTFLFLITPYIGAGAMFGSAGASAGVDADVTRTGTKTFASWSKLVGAPVDANGFILSNDVATFGVRVYGGASLNILILKIDGQGMYNLTDGSYGGSIGARLQL